MHTEQDREAYNDHLASQVLQAKTDDWLSSNPSVGALNSGKFYIIRNGQMIEIARFATLTN